MKIALVTSSFAPFIGGVEEHVRNVAASLRDDGHNVVVWTVARDGRFGIREHEGIEVWDLPAPLPARSVVALARLALLAPRAWRHWRSAYRSFRPDILHIHCFGPNGTYGSLLARRTHTPFVLTSHGETIADDTGVFTHSRFAIDRLRRALTDAAAVTGCSGVAVEDLVARFGLVPGRASVVYNGVDQDEPAGELPAVAHGRFFAAVARVQRLKGFDLLIEAFAEASLPDDVRLVIGGDGPELEALRAQAQRLHVADRVDFTGWLDRGGVVRLRAAAMAGVVPSRFEAFGIAVLEVWRARTPLIATTRGGPPEFVTDEVDGVLVDPEDKREFADALRRVVQDEAFARSLAVAGAERVRDFTWQAVTADYERIYAQIAPAAP